ncbi:ROK family protein [Sporosarcina sp. Marseille-Q4063]|uniref:ROK family protein n=1 Tax=Sporosarcina sp. Marseille-Q4063 TaxID=2810514 RepID=UPI001BB09F3A|nr:ROK family protein [Sporosarcina sp. Marseille-Q4063]QUW21501.1 ROK family protein [Sporosarcina sp. Marseille-Q4063]
MGKGHIDTIKKMNRELVIRTIRMQQPVSRIRLSRILNLSKSTISSIVDDLIKVKVIEEIGFEASTKEGGRRAIQLSFNSKVGYMIGIEVNSSSINGCLTDLDGTIILKQESKFDLTVPKIVSFINEMVYESNLSIEDILAIGCSVPGMVDSLNGIVIDAPELKWKYTLIAEELNQYFNCKIIINNNVNCLAMAEKWSGQAQDCENFIYILIENGIGSAIFANNNLVMGARYTAGEIGFFTFPNDKKKLMNRYGDFGVFDKKTSLLAFPPKARETIQQQKYNQLSSSDQLLFDDILHNLSFGIGNMISLLNPEKVVLGGGLRNLIYERKVELERLINEITPIEYQLAFSTMNSKSAALGSISPALVNIPDLV